MTFEKLNALIDKYNIPSNVRMMSDSGWECDATDMDGVYYNKEQNILVFTQGDGQESYSKPEWILLQTSITEGRRFIGIPFHYWNYRFLEKCLTGVLVNPYFLSKEVRNHGIQ